MQAGQEAIMKPAGQALDPVIQNSCAKDLHPDYTDHAAFVSNLLSQILLHLALNRTLKYSFSLANWFAIALNNK